MDKNACYVSLKTLTYIENSLLYKHTYPLFVYFPPAATAANNKH